MPVARRRVEQPAAVVLLVVQNALQDRLTFGDLLADETVVVDRVKRGGDVIVQVNKKNVDSASQVVAGVHAAPAGQDLLLLVWSQGGAGYRVIHPDQG